MARRMAIVTVGLALTIVSLNMLVARRHARAWPASASRPALAVLFAMTSASVKFSETAEAFGWVGTGQLIGAAAGSAIAGFLIDGIGPTGAYIAATAFAAVGLIVAVVFVKGLPRPAATATPRPIPDTEPVHTIT